MQKGYIETFCSCVAFCYSPFLCTPFTIWYTPFTITRKIYTPFTICDFQAYSVYDMVYSVYDLIF